MRVPARNLSSDGSATCPKIVRLVTKVNQYTFSNLIPMGTITNISTDDKGRKVVAEPCLEPCPIERGMRLLGGKWKGSILWHLKDGPVRFNDLARQMGGASKKMVSQRLQEMEAAGLVKREVISDRPIAVAYEITDFGKTALNFLEALKNWSEANRI